VITVTSVIFEYLPDFPKILVYPDSSALIWPARVRQLLIRSSWQDQSAVTDATIL
jgi:hypothetical protein